MMVIQSFRSDMPAWCDDVKHQLYLLHIISREPGDNESYTFRCMKDFADISRDWLREFYFLSQLFELAI